MNIQPIIIPRSQHPISRKWISPNAIKVLYRLKEHGRLAYLVGGSVRDLVLGREPKDFDIATDARPNEIKKIFRNCRLIGRRFRLAHVYFPNEIIEVATFRSNAVEKQEAIAGTSTEPQSVPEKGAENMTAESKPHAPRMLKSKEGVILRDNVFGTPEEDALRRDFTVNALFYNIADFSVIDYTGGMEDLKRGLIRIIGDPAVRFTEDPVRMVRAVRFAAMLGFEIEEATLQALLLLKNKIALSSNARMYEEVQKLFLSGEGEKVFQLLRKTGLFGVLFPHINAWIDSEENGFPHTWVGKSLEWIDACVQSGRKVEPHILFGLMFGQYIEQKWTRLQTAGMVPLEAVNRAVAEFFGEISAQVQIPKKVVFAVRDILWSQKRFEKRQGKHPVYFLRRPEFYDAFEYLRFKSELTGDRKELCAWWNDLLHRTTYETRSRQGTTLQRKHRSLRLRKRSKYKSRKSETLKV